MNMKTAVGIAFAAAFATVAPLSAQEVKQTLSLDEAIAVTLTENPAMKAAEFEEKAAMQERRAAIGLRMPQINVTGAYAYLGKDIGFDFNEMKGPAKNLAGQLLGSGLIPPEAIPSINGLLNPLLNADWFLTLQDRSLGFVGGGVTMPIWLGGKINAANRAARINERTAAEQGSDQRFAGMTFVLTGGLEQFTRDQAAAMIGRTQEKGYAIVDLTFSDTASIPAYATYYIQTMAAQGVISGYADGTFQPGANITRGQMAKILYNLM